MGRITPVVLQWEDDVDAGSQKEVKKSFSPRERNLRRFKLWGWHCRMEYADETTAGTSLAVHIMKNFTEAREAVPGFGKTLGVMNESHWGAYIGHSGLFNTGGTAIAYNTTCYLPKPVEFERDDFLAVQLIAVNKGSAAKRFEFFMVLLLEVED